MKYTYNIVHVFIYYNSKQLRYVYYVHVMCMHVHVHVHNNIMCIHVHVALLSCILFIIAWFNILLEHMSIISLVVLTASDGVLFLYIHVCTKWDPLLIIITDLVGVLQLCDDRS